MLVDFGLGRIRGENVVECKLTVVVSGRFGFANCYLASVLADGEDRGGVLLGQERTATNHHLNILRHVGLIIIFIIRTQISSVSAPGLGGRIVHEGLPVVLLLRRQPALHVGEVADHLQGVFPDLHESVHEFCRVPLEVEEAVAHIARILLQLNRTVRELLGQIILLHLALEAVGQSLDVLLILGDQFQQLRLLHYNFLL